MCVPSPGQPLSSDERERNHHGDADGEPRGQFGTAASREFS
ncbi:MAG: hypothetical protein ACI9CA_001036, partial [Natronomonas sp.]